MARLRAQFDGRVLVPLEPVDLPMGRVLDVDVKESGELDAGSPLLVLQAVRNPPRVPATDVDELEQAVKQGSRPVQPEGPFGTD